MKTFSSLTLLIVVTACATLNKTEIHERPWILNSNVYSEGTNAMIAQKNFDKLPLDVQELLNEAIASKQEQVDLTPKRDLILSSMHLTNAKAELDGGYVSITPSSITLYHTKEKGECSNFPDVFLNFGFPDLQNKEGLSSPFLYIPAEAEELPFTKLPVTVLNNSKEALGEQETKLFHAYYYLKESDKFLIIRQPEGTLDFQSAWCTPEGECVKGADFEGYSCGA